MGEGVFEERAESLSTKPTSPVPRLRSWHGEVQSLIDRHSLKPK